MAWMAPHMMDLWSGATEEEAREWWEDNRRIHNDFAERFNNDWTNRHMRLLSFGLLPNARKISLMPSYDEMMAKYHKLHEA